MKILNIKIVVSCIAIVLFFSACGQSQPQDNAVSLLPEESVTMGEAEVTLNKDSCDGQWNRTNVWSAMPSSITINNVTEEGFDFDIEASFWSHQGYIIGEAVFVDDSHAISTRIMDDGYTVYKSAQLEFIFDQNALIIPDYDEYSNWLPVGARVTVDGKYVKGKPEYVNADNYRKIVPNDEVATIIEELLIDHSSYDYFNLAARDGYIEPCEVEGFPGYRINTATIGGLQYRIAVTSDNIVFLWQDWGNESSFFTNLVD